MVTLILKKMFAVHAIYLLINAFIYGREENLKTIKNTIKKFLISFCNVRTISRRLAVLVGTHHIT